VSVETDGPHTARPATLEESTHLQSAVLEELTSAVNYTAWLTSLVAPWLGDDPLEIGSGHGDAAALLVAGGQRMTCSEADASRLAVLRDRFAGHATVAVRELKVPILESATHSAVVAFNVLEHIEDDVAALRDFAGLLRPGGRVVLIVPAFELAMSRFDREIGHHRRYRVATMTAALEAAGLRPLRVHYVNSVGLLGWTLLVKLLRSRPRNGLALRLFDRAFVPVLRRLESAVRPPFGQSVFAVAEKP
jgi:SAM-dependent methyltransferase